MCASRSTALLKPCSLTQAHTCTYQPKILNTETKKKVATKLKKGETRICVYTAVVQQLYKVTMDISNVAS